MRRRRHNVVGWPAETYFLYYTYSTRYWIICHNVLRGTWYHPPEGNKGRRSCFTLTDNTAYNPYQEKRTGVIWLSETEGGCLGSWNWGLQREGVKQKKNIIQETMVYIIQVFVFLLFRFFLGFWNMLHNKSKEEHTRLLLTTKFVSLERYGKHIQVLPAACIISY